MSTFAEKRHAPSGTAQVFCVPQTSLDRASAALAFMKRGLQASRLAWGQSLSPGCPGQCRHQLTWLQAEAGDRPLGQQQGEELSPMVAPTGRSDAEAPVGEGVAEAGLDPSTSNSLKKATSSIKGVATPAARQSLPNGSRSCLGACPLLRQLRLAETSCNQTDSTPGVLFSAARRCSPEAPVPQ